MAFCGPDASAATSDGNWTAILALHRALTIHKATRKLTCFRLESVLEMSDITDYFLAHARIATRKARRMRRGTTSRNSQRAVARVYHFLAKEAAYKPNVEYLDDFPAAQLYERKIGSG
jgi:hypothetical protein